MAKEVEKTTFYDIIKIKLPGIPMFKNLKDKRLFERIVDQIKDAVLSGTLKVGDRLPSEHEMAHMFGVSRTAVREAMRVLELSGLVVIKKGNQGGCFIRQVNSNQQLVDYLSDYLRIGNVTLPMLTDIRYWLESTVIDIVGQKATQKDFERLRTSISKAERFYRDGKEEERIFENFRFHILLAQITENTILIDFLSAIFDLLTYMMYKIKPNRTITLRTFEAHRKILQLLEADDVEGAKKANRDHIKGIGSEQIKKYEEEKSIKGGLQDLVLLRKGVGTIEGVIKEETEGSIKDPNRFFNILNNVHRK